MLDWRWPTSPEARMAAIDSNRDLEIVAHLGNQAKHYQVDRHHAVDDLHRTEDWIAPGWVDPGWVQGASIDIGLPDGTWVNAIELAERVIAWWAAKLTKG
jgi:hypothetical protein